MKLLMPFVAATLTLGLTACDTFGGFGRDEPQQQSSIETQQNPMDMYSQLDADQDGNISNYEAQDNAQLTNEFESLDTDDDGVLSADEFIEWEVFDEPAY